MSRAKATKLARKIEERALKANLGRGEVKQVEISLSTDEIAQFEDMAMLVIGCLPLGWRMKRATATTFHVSRS